MLLSNPLRRKTSGSSEEGYILLFLLLIVCLMTIFAATLVTSIKFEMKRDREEEMVHRGVQYMRAIRAYYRKFNRYPAKIEDLENTNQLRFLRKRYKDPLTGKDFKLLHYGEVKMAGSIGGGMIPGANQAGANGTLVSANGQQGSPFGSNSTFGSNSSFGQNSGFGSNSAFGQNSGFGQNSSSPFGQTSNSSNQPQDASGGQNSTGQNSNGDTSQAGSDASQSGTGQQGPGNGINPNSPFGSNSSSDKLGSTQFGGAPIIGVASTSKDKTIREFDKKRKYNEWMFVYDPMMDRGGLIKTPYQPQLMMQMMAQGMNQNGQNPGQNGNNTNGGFGNSGTVNGNGFGNNNGFGSGNGFGNSFGNSPGGMQNNPNSPGGYGNPQPPTQAPQQQ
jgi:hypothetical protein